MLLTLGHPLGVEGFGGKASLTSKPSVLVKGNPKRLLKTLTLRPWSGLGQPQISLRPYLEPRATPCLAVFQQESGPTVRLPISPNGSRLILGPAALLHVALHLPGELHVVPRTKKMAGAAIKLLKFVYDGKLDCSSYLAVAQKTSTKMEPW